MANSKPVFVRTSKIEDDVAASTNIPVHIARNVIRLLKKECSVPFITRYRMEETGSLKPDKLREVQASYKEVKCVQKKVEGILKTSKTNLDEQITSALLNAKTLEEVEFLYAPFKPESKTCLISRARNSGLEAVAEDLFKCKTSLSAINVSAFVDRENGLKNTNEVLLGLQHIIADKISKAAEVLNFLHKIMNDPKIKVISTKSTSVDTDGMKISNEASTSFDSYFHFDNFKEHVAHHQIMAINRGEKQKVLKVRIHIPADVKKEIRRFIWNALFCRKLDQQTAVFLKRCINDAYLHLIKPHLCCQIRVDLTRKAIKECIHLFVSNMRSLLLTSPVRGKPVIGIDPGFVNGCKIAAISSTGEVLKTGIIYPLVGIKKKSDVSDAAQLKNMISLFGVEIIAIGNGMGCRETELWLSNLITSKYFHPFKVEYSIVSEDGVSIYSITSEAEKELPDLAPKIRSAVAIARRLQDPLLEYSKIEPKHVGVGMYQHDLPEHELNEALASVVEECVCLVGVDVNVCPEFLLRNISGLNSEISKEIIKWRNKYGSFINRKELLLVNGLHDKAFEQCAGFLRILPETCKPKGARAKDVKSQMNPLDRTVIHPESYQIAENFLSELRANPREIGSQELVDKVNRYMTFQSTDDVAKRLRTTSPVLELIIDAFKQLPDFDIRGDFEPIFSTSVRKYSELKQDMQLAGKVMALTGFGAFVDIGVKKQGLIYNQKMKNESFSVGDKVLVKVLHTAINKERIGLEFLERLN